VYLSCLWAVSNRLMQYLIQLPKILTSEKEEYQKVFP